MKKTKTLADAMKQDKKLDKKMTPAQLREDIKADKKLLSTKAKKK
jgi:hypothetical protein